MGWEPREVVCIGMGMDAELVRVHRTLGRGSRLLMAVTCKGRSRGKAKQNPSIRKNKLSDTQVPGFEKSPFSFLQLKVR